MDTPHRMCLARVLTVVISPTSRTPEADKRAIGRKSSGNGSECGRPQQANICSTLSTTVRRSGVLLVICLPGTARAGLSLPVCKCWSARYNLTTVTIRLHTFTYIRLRCSGTTCSPGIADSGRIELPMLILQDPTILAAPISKTRRCVLLPSEVTDAI